MGGKVSPGARVQSDTVSINVTRQQAKDLIVALSHALQSGGGKHEKMALADKDTVGQAGKTT